MEVAKALTIMMSNPVKTAIIGPEQKGQNQMKKFKKQGGFKEKN